ncbi:MAG: O-antigen ligase family protein [Bryobacteraceae bacterium]
MRVPRVALLTALPCFVTLTFLPGWSFYYDVIPKAAALLVSVAMLCMYAAWRHELLTIYWTSRSGRWNVALAVAALLIAGVAALSSPIVSLAAMGSEWRRLGALMQAAIVVASFLSVGLAMSANENRLALLRGVCLAGTLASLYAMAQYFGWDPWLDASGYHFGEGQYQIVRPPGPLGHSNYLAAFLLWPVFCGAALFDRERWLSATTMTTATIAIVLCGSRGAIAGLSAGVVVLLVLHRPRLRTMLAALAIATIAGGGFYFSPYGERLRARVFWIGEDAAGGSRLLLWRDSLHMGLERPWTGFGPDTFAAQFPLFQSAELSRRFPDFYHESPHNLFLDAFVGEGIPGLLLWCAWIGLGIYAARRALAGRMRPLAVGLFAGLVASLVAHQFAVLVIPTAFAMLLCIGLLVSLDDEIASPAVKLPSAIVVIGCIALAVFFSFTAFRLFRADLALAKVQQADSTTAGALWRQTDGSAVSANLYLSRLWTVNANNATTAIDKLRWTQIAGEAALAATRDPEQQQNAWYNLAILQASANNATGIEKSLRAAIAAAPTWFKPHWTLARLLAATGRISEAQAEARLALDLNGGHDAEVVATMGDILRSPGKLK